MSDASDEWMPFSLSDTEAEQYQVLVPGVPDWMRERLIMWMCTRLRHPNDWSLASREDVIVVQNESRVDLGVLAGVQSIRLEALSEVLRHKQPMELLRVADCIASRLSESGSAHLQTLETVLASSRSKWTVGTRSGKPGLTERVPEGVQAAVEGTIQSSGAAGKILAKAWGYVHALQPNDSGAYADAVRAVEIASIAVVQPRDATATLGRVLGQMKADGDWRLDLREHVDAPGADMILAMGRRCGSAIAIDTAASTTPT